MENPSPATDINRNLRFIRLLCGSDLPAQATNGGVKFDLVANDSAATRRLYGLDIGFVCPNQATCGIPPPGEAGGIVELSEGTVKLCCVLL